MKITILGSGASGGVPMIGPVWGNCDPDNPKNRRRRASILLETTDSSVLIDASPDCRAQLLDADVCRLDAVVFTHAHADHCHGIDDLRWINQHQGRAIEAFADSVSFEEMNRRFGYAFEPFEVPEHGYFYRPVLEWREIGKRPFSAGGLKFRAYTQDHGYSKTNGLLFGDVAYSTDVVQLDDTAFDLLVGLDLWIVGCLREEPHPTHAHLERVLGWIERVAPRRAVITHMNHMLDYEVLCGKLPDNAVPAYDGMVIEA